MARAGWLVMAALLAGCGVDGAPERPPVPQRGFSGVYYDEQGVMRTPADTVGAGSAAVDASGAPA